MHSSELMDKFSKHTMRVPGGCIFWTGSYSKDGYGVFWIRELRMYRFAHVISLEMKLGRKLESGMLSLHDCSQRACVNPIHLYEGSASQNNVDAWRAGTRYKLNPEGRASLLRLIGDGANIPEACKKFGVKRNWYADHVRLVRLGKRKTEG